MSVAAETPASLAAAPRPRTGGRALRAVRHHLLTAYGILALIYLMLPIGVVIAFSFNDPAGRFNFVWEGFTFSHWADPLGVPGLGEAIGTSLKIAAIVTVAATVLGTLVALALVRYGFRGRGATNILIFLPMTTPEIVLGASLLTLFLNFGVALGFWTIVIAHIMFDISFVVVTVRARLVGFDRNLEDAAADLYASPWQTFRRVTLPLIAPGILAAALLAFALSIDDFVITNLNAGTTVTFPLWVYGAARVGVPPQVNVVGTIIFAVAVGLMFANVLWQRRREKVEARAVAETGIATASENVHT
jgi:spermidine/putrescine transport system permease protein